MKSELLFNQRYRIYKTECQLGISEISEPFKAVYSFIAEQPTTIQRIHAHEYFHNLSLSTIKRAVVELLDKGLIVSEIGKDDRRERTLSIT